MTSKGKLDPLREFLDAVVTRIEVLEAHCGIAAAPSQSSETVQNSASAEDVAEESPSVEGFDKFLNSSVSKLGETCDSLGMENLGKLLIEVFEGMRYVIVLASKSKQPADIIKELQPHLKGMVDAFGKVRSLRLKRDFDNHMKATMEMLACISWLTCRAPQQLPAPFVKECIGSSDFWNNRIRKQFKGKDAPNQLAFCDNMKTLLQDLAAYIVEYHKTGLTFNPKGVSLAEAKDAATAASGKQAKKSKGGNATSMMAELAGRKSKDGSSAATGLKKVTKDQQTWRKEFKGGDTVKPVVKSPAPKKVEPKKKKKAPPVLEYQERGTKWVIENHDKDSAKALSANGLIEVDVSNPKQQVYIYNCEEVTIKVNGGKLKSLIVDTCKKVNVIFDTIISGCELVNSKKVAIQTDGVCPVFTIDKTVGVTIWLSAASAAISSFTTSMSSEMNISMPDGDDRKELPIPEQFVHKISDGKLSSEVSDLYH